jgi:serine/threonine protein kinase
MADARRYEIVETLGRGGFGTVYRAKLVGDGGFAKQVALKVLNPDVAATGEFAARMRDEARILGLIRHRAVVQVDGLVQLNGRWTVVMEYIQGLDLSQLSRVGALPPGPACEIAAEVAAALHTAYATQGPDGRPLRLIHRDIKPANIQVTAQGEVKLLDFGVARAEFDGREAETKSVRFGSIGYMAPERLDGGAEEPPSDVYAVGVVLFELLAGAPYGQTFTNEKRQNAAVTERVGGLASRLGAAGAGIGRLLSEMLAYEPAKRPSARDVERRCAELRGGTSLRDWAEAAVPPLLTGRKPTRDGLTGVVLTEGLAALPALEAADKAAAAAPKSATRWERSGATPPPAAAKSASGALPTAPKPVTAASGKAGFGTGAVVVGGGVMLALVAGVVVVGLIGVVVVALALQ